MRRDEFMVYATLLRTSYPKEKILPNKESMELWYRMLQDIPYKLAETFLQKWISTEKWSPSIADIREGCTNMVTTPVADWGDGWQEVKTAIRRFGYMNESKALESLSPITRVCVQRLGWSRLCSSEDEMTDRANFRTTYETLAKREQQDRQLPAALKETIREIGTKGTSITEFLGNDSKQKI